MTPYPNFAVLAQHEEEGFDYRILHRNGFSGVLVMAPHGGGIEPGTGDIADALAGSAHAFYCFKGLKKRGNRALHITSNRFDEPLAERMLKKTQWVLTIHGCREGAPLVWVGGRDLRRGDTEVRFATEALLEHEGGVRPSDDQTLVAIRENEAHRPLAAVTGGTGFLGRFIVAALIEAGWRVRMLVRSDPVHPLIPHLDAEIVLDKGNIKAFAVIGDKERVGGNVLLKGVEVISVNIARY